MNTKKVIIIGDGNVGASYFFELAISGLADEIGVIDINRDKVRGDVLDIEHSLSFHRGINVYGASYKDCSNADLIVITAGAAQDKNGETRLQLLSRNVLIIKDIVKKIMRSGFDGVFLVATNPVDVISYVIYKESGLSKNRIVGAGTVLDTARLRMDIAKTTKINAGNVHAYVMAEHGDSSFALWSNASVSAIPIREWMRDSGYSIKDTETMLNKFENRVRKAAYEIIDYKGSTYYGIASSLTRITRAILNNENVILTVSAYLNGEFKEKDIFMGVPAVINRTGIRRVIDLKLDEREEKLFHNSAEIIRDAINQVKTVI